MLRHWFLCENRYSVLLREIMRRNEQSNEWREVKKKKTQSDVEHVWYRIGRTKIFRNSNWVGLILHTQFNRFVSFMPMSKWNIKYQREWKRRRWRRGPVRVSEWEKEKQKLDSSSDWTDTRMSTPTNERKIYKVFVDDFIICCVCFSLSCFEAAFFLLLNWKSTKIESTSIQKWRSFLKVERRDFLFSLRYTHPERVDKNENVRTLDNNSCSLTLQIFRIRVDSTLSRCVPVKKIENISDVFAFFLFWSEWQWKRPKKRINALQIIRSATNIVVRKKRFFLLLLLPFIQKFLIVRCMPRKDRLREIETENNVFFFKKGDAAFVCCSVWCARGLAFVVSLIAVSFLW